VQAYIAEAISRGFFSERLLEQIGQIDQKKKVLGWAGMLGLLWLSAAIFDSMATALNIIFRSREKRNFFEAKLMAIAMIPLAWLVGIASIAISYVTALLIAQPVLLMDNLGISLSTASTVALGYIVPFLITTLFLTVVYRVIPTVRIRLTVVVAGSAVCAFLLETAKQFFAWYAANYTRYDVIFGSLEAVVILVVGVFYIALIFLFCAEMISSYERRDILLLEEAILKSRKTIMKVDERLFKKFGRAYEKGSIIFNEGDSGNEMFYVLSGRVHLEKDDSRVKKVLAEIGPGQYFGEMAALIDISRSATARAVEDSQLAVIDSNTFRDMIRESRDVAMHMLQEFSRRLKNSNKAVEELANLRTRLIIIIYFLENPGIIIEKHLPQLAQLTGKLPTEIRVLLNDPVLRDVLIIRDSRLAEVVREKIWLLLDADVSTKHAMEDIGKT
ncbi:MAG: YhjD/YihY/BrkB family envelope integrity protein, partial [Smithella sp.]